MTYAKPRTLKQLKQDERVEDIEIDEGQDH